MNTIKTNKSIIKQLMVSLCVMAGSVSYAQEISDGALAVKIGKAFGSFAGAIHTSLTGFFDSSSSELYQDCAARITEDEAKYRSLCESFESKGLLSKRMQDIFVESLQIFSLPVAVIKNYAGKSADYALSFVVDMKKVFSPDIMFNSVLTKLKALYKDAQAAKEVDLMDLINRLVKLLEQKKNEWSNKKSHTLLSGLTKRMSLK